MLVIACNSASAAMLQGRPRALRGPGRRGDPPGRPPRRRRHPQRPRRRHLHPGHQDLLSHTRTHSPPRHMCDSSQPGVPALRRVRRGRRHRRRGTDQGRTRVPRPGRGRRSGHADPRLHALSAAHRRHLVRHGRRVTLISSAEETAKDVYRPPREARPDARRVASTAPAHEFRTTGDPERFKEIGRRFLGPELSRVARGGYARLMTQGSSSPAQSVLRDRRTHRRPASPGHHHPQLARPRRGLGAGRVRPHPGALRRLA